jgi:hypothetical protein
MEGVLLLGEGSQRVWAVASARRQALHLAGVDRYTVEALVKNEEH